MLWHVCCSTLIASLFLANILPVAVADGITWSAKIPGDYSLPPKNLLKYNGDHQPLYDSVSNTIITRGANWSVVAFDATTGDVKWQSPACHSDGNPTNWCVYTWPWIAAEGIVVAHQRTQWESSSSSSSSLLSSSLTSSSSISRFRAWNASNGEVLWTSDTSQQSAFETHEGKVAYLPAPSFSFSRAVFNDDGDGGAYWFVVNQGSDTYLIGRHLSNTKTFSFARDQYWDRLPDRSSSDSYLVVSGFDGFSHASMTVFDKQGSNISQINFPTNPPTENSFPRFAYNNKYILSVDFHDSTGIMVINSWTMPDLKPLIVNLTMDGFPVNDLTNMAPDVGTTDGKYFFITEEIFGFKDTFWVLDVTRNDVPPTLTPISPHNFGFYVAQVGQAPARAAGEEEDVLFIAEQSKPPSSTGTLMSLHICAFQASTNSVTGQVTLTLITSASSGGGCTHVTDSYQYQRNSQLSRLLAFDDGSVVGTFGFESEDLLVTFRHQIYQPAIPSGSTTAIPHVTTQQPSSFTPVPSTTAQTPIPFPPTPAPSGSNGGHDCGRFSSCIECTNAPSGTCGFCTSTKKCEHGDVNGPSHGTCGGRDSSWEWYASQCQN